MSFNSPDNITLKASLPQFDLSGVEHYSFDVAPSEQLLSESTTQKQSTQINESNDSVRNQPDRSLIADGTKLSSIQKDNSQSITRAQAIAAAQKRVSLQMSAKLHRAAKLAALDEDETLNSLMVRLLRQYLSQRQDSEQLLNYR